MRQMNHERMFYKLGISMQPQHAARSKQLESQVSLAAAASQEPHEGPVES